eukprot:scaffold1881_cov256-Pinguiococcus_pyrenoidosus.AAC.20
MSTLGSSLAWDRFPICGEQPSGGGSDEKLAPRGVKTTTRARKTGDPGRVFGILPRRNGPELPPPELQQDERPISSSERELLKSRWPSISPFHDLLPGAVLRSETLNAPYGVNEARGSGRSVVEDNPHVILDARSLRRST